MSLVSQEVVPLMTTVKASIESKFKESGTRLFWPENFREEGLTLAEAQKACSDLVAEGLLVEIWTLYSPEGHKCWEGPRKDLKFPVRCTDLECEHITYDASCREDAGGEALESRFEMSDAWVTALADTIEWPGRGLLTRQEPDYRTKPGYRLYVREGAYRLCLTMVGSVQYPYWNATLSQEEEHVTGKAPTYMEAMAQAENDLLRKIAALSTLLKP